MELLLRNICEDRTIAFMFVIIFCISIVLLSFMEIRIIDKLFYLYYKCVCDLNFNLVFWHI